MAAEAKAKAAQEKQRQEMEAALQEEETRRRAEREKRHQVDGEYTLLGDAWQDDTDPEVGNTSIAALENYRYFDGDAILASHNLPANVRKKGEKLYSQGIADGIQINMGYLQRSPGYYRQNSDEDESGMVGMATLELETIQTKITFSRFAVLRAQCDCPTCRKKNGGYSWYYAPDCKCEYVATVLYKLRDCLARTNLGDATDRNADRLMAIYEQHHVQRETASLENREESVTLKPRLVRKNGSLTVSFKIGTGRMFVIKQLDDFCENVRNAATTQYGSGTEINHRRSNFTEESQKWLRFIDRIVQEEEEFCQRLDDAIRSSHFYYRKSAKVGGSLNLFGWRLDELYKEIGDGVIDFEDRDADRKKLVLRCGTGNPRVTMQISEAKTAGSQTKGTQKKTNARKTDSPEEFHGIQVEGYLPEFFFGTNCAYYIKEDTLYRSEDGFQEKIEPLVSICDENGRFFFRFGRSTMSEFYHQILPDLRDIAEIIETDPDRFHAYLPPAAGFIFYLDAQNGDIQCKPFSRYGDIRFSLLDLVDDGEITPDDEIESYRDLFAEQSVLYRIMRWFPYIDRQHQELVCHGDEDEIYHAMSAGVEDMMVLGEVQCTPRFKAHRRIRQIKVSVGVSVSSGLLDLDISTDDVPQEELLDLLTGYRAKKELLPLKRRLLCEPGKPVIGASGGADGFHAFECKRVRKRKNAPSTVPDAVSEQNAGGERGGIQRPRQPFPRNGQGVQDRKRCRFRCTEESCKNYEEISERRL